MDEQDEDLGSFSSFDDDNDEMAESINSMISSSSSDFVDDATSSSSNGGMEEEKGSLFEMSDLIDQLPLRSGLSKHFQGKSQSFSSLSDVKILEDLPKPERSYKKKLKSSEIYGGVSDSNKALSCAKAITKNSSRGSFSSLGTTRKGFFGNSRLSFSLLRSAADFFGQAPLFA